MNDRAPSWPFYVLVFSIFLALVSPHLLSDGMFLDGLIYATLSRNLAEGIGGLWTPYYTGPAGTVFYEHPPLAFWLQSIFYKMVGDSIYVERIYSFMTFVLTGYGMTRIWKSVVKGEQVKISWLPLFLFIITPTVFWAATNNMLENTMMIFITGAVYFYLCGRSGRNHFLYLGISGGLLSLGFLTKGFTSLFPLSLPFWIWLIRKEDGFLKMVTDSLLLVIFTSLPLIILFKANAAAGEYILIYIDHQVWSSIKTAETADGRYVILILWLNDILPPLIGSGLILWVSLKKKVVRWTDLKENSRWAMIFCMVGFSGVLPIMITLRQSSFYILPTFVFFSLSLALWISPAVNFLLLNLKSILKIKIIALTLFVVSLAFATAQIGSIGRDKDELDDVFKIIDIVPERSMVRISPDLATVWGLQAQFARYAHISLDPQSSQEYYVVMKGETHLLEGYRKVDLNTSLYELYKRN